MTTINRTPAAIGPSKENRVTDRAASHDKALEDAVKNSDIMRQAFYAVVLLVALGGQVSGAVEALHLPWLIAIPAVGALELGGVVVMTNADIRRRLGERATISRILSAAIALGAVAFNWLAHTDHLLGGFFAGMSLLGYLVYLMHTENKRRDRLRAKGNLPPTTPAYELYGHWLRHPLLTRRARSLAKANDELGLYESLAAAHNEIIEEQRLAAIAKIVRRRMRRTAQSKDHAALAVAAYPMDQIAERVAGRADLDALAAEIAIEMAPGTTAVAHRPRWAAVAPWKWSNKLAATLAAQAAQYQRAVAEAQERAAAKTARIEAELADAHMRAQSAEDALEKLRAETAQTAATLRAQTDERVRAAAEQARAQAAQEHAAHTAQLRAQTDETLRAQVAEAERAARAQTLEELRAQTPKPAAQNTAKHSDQPKPREVATLRSDETIAEQLWPEYADKMRADSEPPKEYRVRVAGKCADRQAKRVLGILAQRWTAQTAQTTARSTAQPSAQTPEPARADDRADRAEEAS